MRQNRAEGHHVNRKKSEVFTKARVRCRLASSTRLLSAIGAFPVVIQACDFRNSVLQSELLKIFTDSA